MALDTAVPGEANSVLGLAHWLSGTLSPRVIAGSDAIAAARRAAESDWEGDAGLAFAGRMGSANRQSDDLDTGIVEMARTIEAYGQAIRIAQEGMAAIRAAAAAAGLTVTGMAIQDPGPAPANPGPPLLAERDGLRLTAHANATAAFQGHQNAAAAFAAAVADAEHVRSQLRAAGEALDDTYRGLKGPQWALNAVTLAGGLAGAAMVFNADAMRQRAAFVRGQGVVAWQRAAVSPSGLGTKFLYSDIDFAKSLDARADGLARHGDDLARRANRMPIKLGGAAAVLGIGYDIHSGKDPTQAAVVGTGSFLASVGAGAAIGSLIPVPGVGTAVGAIGGAAFGIFASGALDSVFENGPDVQAAWDAGATSVVDTGKAIGGATVSVAKSIGGLF